MRTLKLKLPLKENQLNPDADEDFETGLANYVKWIALEHDLNFFPEVDYAEARKILHEAANFEQLYPQTRDDLKRLREMPTRGISMETFITETVKARMSHYVRLGIAQEVAKMLQNPKQFGI